MLRATLAAAIAAALLSVMPMGADAGAQPPPRGTPPPEITPPPGIQPPPIGIRLELRRDCLDVSSNGVVPTVLYGSATLDVTKIDLATVRLAGAPALRPGRSDPSLVDLDADGYLDLQARFRLSDMTVAPSATFVAVTGLFSSGQKLQGSVKIEVCAN